MDFAFPLILVAFIGLAVGVAYLSYVGKKRRREGFALVATQLGMEFWPEDPFGLLSEPFALFEKGDGRGVENVLSGSWHDLHVRLFDYWYYEESTNSKGHTSKTYYRFDCVVTSVDAACSRLVIGHENVGTWLAGALTFHDIQFESEDFNREFNVQSPDAKFANDFVDARMMEWLMKNGEGFSFEVDDDRMLCFHRQLRPIEVVPLLGVAKAFRDHIPRVVYSLYPRATPLPSGVDPGREAANEARWLAGHWTPPAVEDDERPPPI